MNVSWKIKMCGLHGRCLLLMMMFWIGFELLLMKLVLCQSLWGQTQILSGMRGRTSFVLIGCQRSGQYRVRKKDLVRTNTGSRKYGCPFKIYGKSVVRSWRGGKNKGRKMKEQQEKKRERWCSSMHRCAPSSTTWKKNERKGIISAEAEEENRRWRSGGASSVQKLCKTLEVC